MLIFLDGFKLRLMIVSVALVKFVCKDWNLQNQYGIEFGE